MIDVTTGDEIGELTRAFNAMVEQLRKSEKMRETFGRYIDPRVIEALVDRPGSCGSGSLGRAASAVGRSSPSSNSVFSTTSSSSVMLQVWLVDGASPPHLSGAGVPDRLG